jgi:aryl-alcohol dehydrogenase-like predicted oxidoreductase
MQLRNLGASGLKVSIIGLGCNNFGMRIDQAQTRMVVDAALDCGVNFFDTADIYGGSKSEVFLGDALKGRRDKAVLATKFANPMGEGAYLRGGARRYIVKAVEDSLKRLHTDHIDLYQMHHIDRAAPVEEILQAMDRLIAQGKITYVGSSNFPGWAIARFNEKALASHRLGLVCEQSLYNLVERRAELEVLPACQAYGVGVIAWSPLAGGLLAGASGETSGRRAGAQARDAAQLNAPGLAAFTAFCAELGQAPGVVAIAWLLHQPGITSAIVGPRRRDQFAALLQAPRLGLDESALARLDAIFPACGAAPEAYAW